MVNSNTPAWVTFTFISFGVSIAMAFGGIYMLDANFWMKSYLFMASLLLINSTITMAKTIRDQHEQKRLHHRLDEAKAERLLKDYETAA